MIRHVWVRPEHTPTEMAGLVLEWRQTPDGWEAQVTYVEPRGRAVTEWLPCSARLLLPSIGDIADSMVFFHGDYEQTAEELWVDPWTLEVRMASLHGLERKYLNKRLEDAILL